MSSIVKELWVFSKGGIPLIELFQKDKLEPSLLGGFCSAIKSFSIKLSGNELNSFEMGGNKYTLASALDGSVFLVCNSPSQIKDKNIKKICKVIVNIFEDMFSCSDIENWKGDVSFFTAFKQKLDLYFKMSNL